MAISGSNVYIVWYQSNTDETSSDAFLRRSTDGGATWKSKLNLSNTGDAEVGPDVAASSTTVFVTWDDRITPDIHFRRSTNSGVNWGTPVNLSNDGQSIDAQIAV